MDFVADFCVAFHVSDVEHFMFYLLCAIDEEGYHVVGYFSKVASDYCSKLAGVWTVSFYCICFSLP